MSEPQATGPGPPTPWNYMVTGCAARYCITHGRANRGFRSPSPAAIRANDGRANHGATL
jgi:hypothetical protein